MKLRFTSELYCSNDTDVELMPVTIMHLYGIAKVFFAKMKNRAE